MPRLFTKGFTLVELLVVIAVLGVLAASVLIAINPLEQLARARDAGRKSTITQIGKAMTAYYTNTGAYFHWNGYLPSGASTGHGATDWIGILKDTGDLKTIPGPIAGGLDCWWSRGGDTGDQNNYCYYGNYDQVNPPTDVYIWTTVESQSEIKKCGPNVTPSINNGPYYVYDTSLGHACLKCPGAAGGNSRPWNFAGVCNATQ